MGSSRPRARLSAEDHCQCLTKPCSGPPRGCPPPLSATVARHIGRASDGGSEGMASPDPSKIERKTETEHINIDSFLPHRGLRDGMMRWTNGLPSATTRLGAKMALRGLAASQPGCARIPMMVRSKRCSTKRPDTLMQLSRSSLLEAPSCNARPGHTWRYDAVTCHALQSANLRCPAILHYASIDAGRPISGRSNG